MRAPKGDVRLRGSGTTGVRLIERLLWEEKSGYQRLSFHLVRLERSAAAFGYPFSLKEAMQALRFGRIATRARVRLMLSHNGAIEVEPEPFPRPKPRMWSAVISPDLLDPSDPWLRHKTTNRDLYDTARRNRPVDVDEIIFANELGHVCEGATTNIFADFGDGMVTPPLKDGLLPGTLRAEMLELGQVREETIPLDSIHDAKALFLGNSVRGLIRVRLVK